MARRCIILLVLIVVTLAVFGPVWDHGFVVLDDGAHIVENPYLKPPSISKTLALWKAPYGSLYIPVTYSAWAGLAWLSEIFARGGVGTKLDPRLFHAANVALHLLCAFLVFVILKIIVRADWAACGGALFFALHPVQVEPVAWATGMKDLLCGLFSFAALWQYLCYAVPGSSEGKSGKGAETLPGVTGTMGQRRRWLHYALALAAFVLALLSKPAAVVVPIMAWILDTLYLRRPLRESSVALAGWVAVALPFVVLTKWLQPDADVGFTAPLWARPLVAADAVTFYLYKLFFPLWLGPDYGRSPEMVMRQGWIYFGWIIPAGLAVLIWFWTKRRPLLLVSLALFVAGILPVSGLVPFGFQKISTVADRYLYLSMLGPALAVAWFLSERRGKMIAAICVLVLGLLGIRSALQIRYWQDSTTLFQHALEINPDSWVSHFNLGLALDRKGMHEEAMARYSQALRINPDYSMAHNNIGAILLDRNNVQEAAEHFRLALRADTENSEAHYNLGLLLWRRGQWEEAIAQFRRVLQIKPFNVDARDYLGFLLAQSGRLEEALAEIREGLKIDPAHARAYFNMGLAYARVTRYREAEAALRKAVALNPESAGAYNSLSRLYIELGRFEEAVALADAAIERDPKLNWAYFNRAWALESLGRYQEAEAAYRQALQLDSAQGQVRQRLLSLQARLGKVKAQKEIAR